MTPTTPHTMFQTQVEVANHYRLFIDTLVQEGAQLHEILDTLHSASDLDTLELRINSGGGYVSHGQQLINVMTDRFKDRSLTVIDAEACSMAALLFMAGSTRVIYPHSILMVHDVSMYLAGKSNETARRMKVEVPALKEYFRNLFKDVMSEDDIEKVFDGTDLWFGAEKMCVNGMADFVLDSGSRLTAKEYLFKINPEKYPKDKVVAVEDSDSGPEEG